MTLVAARLTVTWPEPSLAGAPAVMLPDLLVVSIVVGLLHRN